MGFVQLLEHGAAGDLIGVCGQFLFRQGFAEQAQVAVVLREGAQVLISGEIMDRLLIASADPHHVGGQLITGAGAKEVGEISAAALDRIRITGELGNAFEHVAQFIGRKQRVVGDRVQRHIAGTEFDENLREFAVVLHILRTFFPRHQIKGRLGDVKVALLDQIRHVTAEKRQQQGADVRAVDIGIGHDDNLVVADFLDLEGTFHVAITNSGADGGDH